MSVEAFTWALRVPVGGNQKVILLGLANHAHPDGGEAYPALDTLAEYAHCDRSTARRNVRKLIELGWIEEDGRGPRGQIKYRLAMSDQPLIAARGGNTPPVAPMPPGGGISHLPGVAPVPPEPSKEPSKEAVDSSSAREVPSVAYRGKAVHPTYVRRAVEALRVFREATGRQGPSAVDAQGRPTPALKQVVGAIVARPEVQFSAWEAGIRRIVAQPPSWIEGPIQLGQVFGERAAEWVLAPPAGRPTASPQAPPARGRGGFAADAVEANMEMLRRMAEAERAASPVPVDALGSGDEIVDAEVLDERD